MKTLEQISMDLDYNIAKVSESRNISIQRSLIMLRNSGYNFTDDTINDISNIVGKLWFQRSKINDDANIIINLYKSIKLALIHGALKSEFYHNDLVLNSDAIIEVKCQNCDERTMLVNDDKKLTLFLEGYKSALAYVVAHYPDRINEDKIILIKNWMLARYSTEGNNIYAKNNTLSIII